MKKAMFATKEPLKPYNHQSGQIFLVCSFLYLAHFSSTCLSAGGPNTERSLCFQSGCHKYAVRASLPCNQTADIIYESTFITLFFFNSALFLPECWNVLRTWTSVVAVQQANELKHAESKHRKSKCKDVDCSVSFCFLPSPLEVWYSYS